MPLQWLETHSVGFFFFFLLIECLDLLDFIYLTGGNVYGFFRRDSWNWRRMRQWLRWPQPGKCFGTDGGPYDERRENYLVL